MAPRRCRSCQVLAPGGEVPVVRPSELWANWHLCGHCWGLLIVGLQRDRPPGTRLNISSELRDLHLSPADVRAAIQDGLRAAGGHTDAHGGRTLPLDDAQRLLADLHALAREVEASATYGAPRQAWSTIRQRIRDIRAEVRDLNRRYSSALHRDVSGEGPARRT